METTNPQIATADGHALALRNHELRDMNHAVPSTVLYIAGSSRYLISEAVRGEGIRLLDCNGYRFMHDYDSAGELAPRDVVSQAITQQMAKTAHPCVSGSFFHPGKPRATSISAYRPGLYGFRAGSDER